MALTETEREVLDRLDRNFERMSVELREWRKQDVRRIEDLEHAMFGNGRPGVQETVTRVATALEERSSPRKTAAVSGGLSAALTLLVAELARRLSGAA